MNKYLFAGIAIALVGVGGWLYFNKTNTQQPVQNSPTMPTASPTSGNAPLNVEFTFSVPTELRVKNLAGDVAAARIGVDFGDKSEIVWTNLSAQEIVGMNVQKVHHTYTTPGSYAAKLVLDCGKDACPTAAIATVVVLQPAKTSTAVQNVSWHTEPANPGVTDPNDTKKYEQAISLDVTFTDKSTKRYSVSKAYGCDTANVPKASELGRMKCNFADSATDFVVYLQDGKLVVERQSESSMDGSIQTTALLKI